MKIKKNFLKNYLKTINEKVKKCPFIGTLCTKNNCHFFIEDNKKSFCLIKETFKLQYDQMKFKKLDPIKIKFNPETKKHIYRDETKVRKAILKSLGFKNSLVDVNLIEGKTINVKLSRAKQISLARTMLKELKQ